MKLNLKHNFINMLPLIPYIVIIIFLGIFGIGMMILRSVLQ